MKKSNVVIIENLLDGKLVVPVQNFSKDNVISAISVALKIKPQDLKHLSSSMSRGFYGVTKIVPLMYFKITSPEGEPSSSDGCFKVIQVSYAKMLYEE